MHYLTVAQYPVDDLLKWWRHLLSLTVLDRQTLSSALMMALLAVVKQLDGYENVVVPRSMVLMVRWLGVHRDLDHV